MLGFLSRFTAAGAAKSVSLPDGEGEVAGIFYRIRGVGPPLVLLPLFLTPSQWEPLMPALSERYCTITLGGAALGPVAILEARGHAIGYLEMVRTLIEVAELRSGEAILEVGCGSGVPARWLARRMAGRNRITGVDIKTPICCARPRPSPGKRGSKARSSFAMAMPRRCRLPTTALNS